jgi:CelD/BcsL family acetyltransferase involved in cellulose biosynthesis
LKQTGRRRSLGQYCFDVSQSADAAGRTPDRLVVEQVPPDSWEQIADWDDAVAASAAPTIFLTRDWVSAWWANFAEGRDPCVLRVASPDGATAGIGPFYVERLGVRANRLGVLGDQVVGSEYLGIVARKGYEATVARSIAHWLADGAPRWHVAQLSGLREDDPAAEELERALRARAAKALAVEHPCAAIALPGDPDEYLASLGSKFRSSYRQRTNKLLRACDVRFFRTEDEDELPRHLQTLFRMNQVRWTEAGMFAAFTDPRLRSFYLDVSRRLLSSGSLRFWQLEVDGVIRACQYAFAYDGVLHSLQEAYDTHWSLPGVSGLGVVLRGHVLRAAIEEGLDTYDFLGGEEDHKLRWGASIHRVRHLSVARPGAMGRLGWAATAGPRLARDSIKSALPDPMLELVRKGRARYQRLRFGRR